MFRECTIEESRAEFPSGLRAKLVAFAIDHQEHQDVHLCMTLTGAEGRAAQSGTNNHRLRFEKSDLVQLARHILRELDPIPPEQLLEEIRRRIDEK